MDNRETSGIRELTGTELDEIAGGTPSLGEIVTTVVKWGAGKLGIDVDKTIDTAKDVGAAIWKPIQLPF